MYRQLEMPGQSVPRTGRNDAQVTGSTNQCRGNLIHGAIATHGNDVGKSFLNFFNSNIKSMSPVLRIANFKLFLRKFLKNGIMDHLLLTGSRNRINNKYIFIELRSSFVIHVLK